MAAALAPDVGQAGPAGQGPAPVPVEEGPAVDPERERAPDERLGQVLVAEVPDDRGQDEAEPASPLAVFLEPANDAVVAERLDFGARAHAVEIDGRVLPARSGR